RRGRYVRGARGEWWGKRDGGGNGRAGAANVNAGWRWYLRIHVKALTLKALRRGNNLKRCLQNFDFINNGGYRNACRGNNAVGRIVGRRDEQNITETDTSLE
ncbi:MAG: hypothetical protein ACKPKO_31825, partial [Candidatus Fonsibacter sp.]